MTTVIVPIDGVIRTDLGAPFQIGQFLYRVLAENYRVVLASPLSVSETEGLMKRNGLTGWAVVREGSVLDVLRKERVQSHVHFCVVTTEKEAKKVFQQGITVLRISGSDFINPKWRAEKKTWASIKKEAGN